MAIGVLGHGRCECRGTGRSHEKSIGRPMRPILPGGPAAPESAVEGVEPVAVECLVHRGVRVAAAVIPGDVGFRSRVVGGLVRADRAVDEEL